MNRGKNALLYNKKAQYTSCFANSVSSTRDKSQTLSKDIPRGT